MGYREIEKKSASDLYQDIIDLGGLNHAINEALKSDGSILEASVIEGEPLFYSRIEYNERSSQIMIAMNERLFSADLWCEGISYGTWWFKELIHVAVFVKSFIEMRLSVKEMQKKFVWFHSKAGELHEKGAIKETKQRWKDIISRLKEEKSKSTIKNLLPCVKVAKEFTELIALFPYMSMNTLCFSLTTGFPYATIGPQITVWEEYIEIKFDESESKKVYSTKELRKYIEQNIVYYGIARQGNAYSK